VKGLRSTPWRNEEEETNVNVVIEILSGDQPYKGAPEWLRTAAILLPLTALPAVMQ
jgi:hypothetical protein